jgi:hypothetical protein
MPCVPAPVTRAIPAPRADAFAFSPSLGALDRTFTNTATLMTAPWLAFWAFAFEALNPENYHL